MKIAVIGTIGGWSSERLADAVEALTGYRLLVDMSHVRLHMPSGSLFYGDVDLSTLDGLIIKKIGARYSPDLLDRLEMLRLLHERGLPIFSSPLSILRVLNRLTCTVTLQNAGIPMPPTTITEDVGHAVATIKDYGSAIVKPLYSSKARGMSILEEGPELESQVLQFKKHNSIMYIQKTIDLEGNKDLGIVFLGGKYLTTYARQGNQGSWNTSTSNGGKYAEYTPSDEIIAMAQRAQDCFNLDFTCVDVALTKEGPYVFEVSAFGGFRGILQTSGLDAADLYAKHAMHCIG